MRGWLFYDWRHQNEQEQTDSGPPVTTKSPAPRIAVAVLCDMVATVDRVRLDTFTPETWRKFDPKDLDR